LAALLEPGQIGKREDLADLIALVDAHDCPVVSSAKKGSKPGNTLMSWQADSYASTSTAGVVDGTDVGSSDYQNPGENRKVLQAYVQIHRRTIRVSPLALEISNVAGLKDELANGIAKKLVELKRDMEATYLSANAAQLDAGGSTPYKTRGLAKWIEVSGSKDSVLPVDDSFCTPAGSIETTQTTANIEDTHVQDLLASIYSQTGSIKSYTMPCGRTLKRAFTDRLTGVRSATDSNGIAATQIRTFSPQSGKKVTMSVDVFEGDFGTVALVPDNFMPAQTDGYVLDMDGIEIRYGKLPEVKELPDSGGGPIRMLEAVAALIVHNPLSHGKFDLAS
tara:strand:+ start:2114 stop:3118 length:1005 start_codon:yes stop_codon:yes gene_type:complete